MKKKYEKPQIYIEKFELAQHIAGCDFKLNSMDVNNCTAPNEFNAENLLFIVNANQNCKAEAEGYCYFNASDGLVTFTS